MYILWENAHHDKMHALVIINGPSKKTKLIAFTDFKVSKIASFTAHIEGIPGFSLMRTSAMTVSGCL